MEEYNVVAWIESVLAQYETECVGWDAHDDFIWVYLSEECTQVADFMIDRIKTRVDCTIGIVLLCGNLALLIKDYAIKR